MMAAVRTYPDPAALALAAAELFVTAANEAVRERGYFAVALSGGNTPRGLYETLAYPPLREQVAWDRVHVFWGDERCVPPDHSESNFRMARHTLLNHVPIPARNIHRIHGEMEPDKAAARYEQVLRRFFSRDHEQSQDILPHFDLVLLGLGNDGHTASLFPGTPALHEQTRWVVAQHVDQVHGWRITLTPVAINAARQATFLVSGQAKAERLRQVLQGPRNPDRLPAQIVRPRDGHLLWLADADAAALL